MIVSFKTFVLHMSAGDSKKENEEKKRTNYSPVARDSSLVGMDGFVDVFDKPESHKETHGTQHQRESV